jgi:hypothetical protein
MRNFDSGETRARGDEQDRAMSQHSGQAEEQRRRLQIYRVALERLRAESEAGTPASRATWQVAYEVYDGFALDTRQFALLVRCLIAATRET